MFQIVPWTKKKKSFQRNSVFYVLSGSVTVWNLSNSGFLLLPFSPLVIISWCRKFMSYTHFLISVFVRRQRGRRQFNFGWTVLAVTVICKSGHTGGEVSNHSVSLPTQQFLFCLKIQDQPISLVDNRNTILQQGQQQVLFSKQAGSQGSKDRRLGVSSESVPAVILLLIFVY